MNFCNLNFKYPWRTYQKKVLDEIEKHLDDNKLNIVAAPGAGKTTLGIEVFRLLNKKAIILSPTRLIRDQWISRLDDFLEDVNEKEVFTSMNLEELNSYTSSTYQALYSKISNNKDKLDETKLNSFIKDLQKQKIELLILDESHHLRASWSEALNKVLKKLPNIITLSLTATPPYDSNQSQWDKYYKLCGDIDEEISIPQLVKSKNLCAHQDYVYLSDASVKEKEKIEEFVNEVNNTLDSLLENKKFEELIKSLELKEEELLKNPEFIISVLSFKKEKNIDILQFLEKLDLEEEDISKLDIYLWEILLKNLLFNRSLDFTKEQKEFLDNIKKQLKYNSLLVNKQFYLLKSKKLEKALSLSTSKIQACEFLHHLEYKTREDSLCQVILTDFIKDEYLKLDLKFEKMSLGAFPIFYKLIQSSYIKEKIALHTGRISYLHSSFKTLLEENKIKYKNVDFNKSYLELLGSISSITNFLTKLLNEGKIKTLVGTQSLLGEGWDAPKINSLILASNVGSFMLTNQMRGRAIRIDKKDKNKTSTIWHLAAIDTKRENGYSDLESLKDKFKVFVGLDEKNNTIESSYERIFEQRENFLDLIKSKSLSIKSKNNFMIEKYKEFPKLLKLWEEALDKGNDYKRVVPTIKTKRVKTLKKFYMKNFFKSLVSNTILISIAHLFYSFPSYFDYDLEFSMAGVVVVLLLLAIKTLPDFYKITKSLFLHLPNEGSLYQMAEVLLESLVQTKQIKTPLKDIKIVVDSYYNNDFLVAIKGCTYYESSIFTNEFSHLVSKIENPRYLITREEKGLFSKIKTDYHSIPPRLANKKEYAQIFYENWLKKMGKAALIYTRSKEGKEKLLKARYKSYSSLDTRKDENKRVDKWI